MGAPNKSRLCAALHSTLSVTRTHRRPNVDVVVDVDVGVHESRSATATVIVVDWAKIALFAKQPGTLAAAGNRSRWDELHATLINERTSERSRASACKFSPPTWKLIRTHYYAQPTVERVDSSTMNTNAYFGNRIRTCKY